MSSVTSATLDVPGASIYYEVRGTGPLLLLIAGGGGGGAGDWNGFVNYLTDSYTVVTYDRRGALRSTLNEPTESIPLEVHSDDVYRLLTSLTNEPAYVFGSSAGALIALDLVARHPAQVRTLVAHEPPAHYLLHDDQQSRPDPLEVYRREGPAFALRQYIAQLGMSYEDREPDVKFPERNADALANAEALFKYTFQAVRHYRLDPEALQSAQTRIIIAGGSTGREYGGYRGALAVANLLGTTVTEFPSNHAGYMTYPRAFAHRLKAVLSEKSTT